MVGTPDLFFWGAKVKFLWANILSRSVNVLIGLHLAVITVTFK